MNDLCRRLTFHFANGSGLADADDNWTFRSTLGALRRIDYILHSPGFIM